MTAAEKTRYPVLSVPDAEVTDWYALGWAYVGVDESTVGHAAIKWEHDKPAVAPLNERAHGHEGESDQ